MPGDSQDKTILIGIGNEFRQDDGVGLYISRELKSKNISGVTVLEHGGEVVDLIEIWQKYERVFLFDAVSSGGTPGTIHRFDIPEQMVPKSFSLSSTHSISIADVIQLARTLYTLPLRMVVYGIEGTSFVMGEGLSEPVKNSAKQVIKTVIKELEE